MIEPKPLIFLRAHATETRKSWYLCGCGKEFYALNYNVKSRHTRSCGCLRRKNAQTLFTKHGHTCGRKHSKMYVCWRNMFERCFTPTNNKFSLYGGRGITVCSRWVKSFEHFVEDMGEPPSLQHSIDRIDNEKDYCPNNCRWATRIEQTNNTRNNVRHILSTGEQGTQAELCRKYNISYFTFKTRIKNGWTPEEALTTPVRQKKKSSPR